MNSISVFVHRILGAVLGMILLVAGLVLAASAAFAALIVAGAVLVWARLRGVPVLRAVAPRQRGDVVDVQVREVPDSDERRS